jgi:antitoxin VapB
MALNIKDPETDRLVRRLADATGEKITDAVRIAVSERLERVTRRRGKASMEELLAIADRVASKPVVDPRTPEEIIGYDENGLPA